MNNKGEYMKKETEFFKNATIERVRNRIVLVYMDLNKKVHIRTKMMNEVCKFKKMIKEFEVKIDNLTTEIMEHRAEIDLCEVFLLGAKKAGATNADSPIHYVNAETDETEDNSNKDVDEDDAECVEEE